MRAKPMTPLLLTLSAIALVDHLSMWPLALIPLTVARGSPCPLLSSLAFIAGIFSAYFVCGLVILFTATHKPPFLS